MKRHILFAISLAAVTVASPAAASDAKSATIAKENAIHCLKADFTGTRLARKICKTAKEWKAEGVEVRRR